MDYTSLSKPEWIRLLLSSDTIKTPKVYEMGV